MYTGVKQVANYSYNYIVIQIPSLKHYFIGLNYNMKQTLDTYLHSIGKDPAAMWSKIEDSIANVYINKEHLMVSAAATMGHDNR